MSTEIGDRSLAQLAPGARHPSGRVQLRNLLAPGLIPVVCWAVVASPLFHKVAPPGTHQGRSAGYTAHRSALRGPVSGAVQRRRRHAASDADLLAHLTDLSGWRPLGADGDPTAISPRQPARLCHLDGQAHL